MIATNNSFSYIVSITITGGLRHSQHSQVRMSDYLKWNLPTIHFHFHFIHLGRVALQHSCFSRGPPLKLLQYNLKNNRNTLQNSNRI